MITAADIILITTCITLLASDVNTKEKVRGHVAETRTKDGIRGGGWKKSE